MKEEEKQQKLSVNIKKLKQYCCYELRRKKVNFEQEMISILA